MGWVTLTLRKRELKQEHAYYQLRDLQISREKRQLARSKQYETAVIQNEQQEAIAGLKEEYNTKKDVIRDAISEIRTNTKEKNANLSNGEDKLDVNTETINYDGQEMTISDLNALLSDAQVDYSDQNNFEKTIYESELAMLEEEASDKETQLDMEQTEVEAQMEAISQEMQAVSEAVSTEIQNSTIKLA